MGVEGTIHGACYPSKTFLPFQAIATVSAYPLIFGMMGSLGETWVRFNTTHECRHKFNNANFHFKKYLSVMLSHGNAKFTTKFFRFHVSDYSKLWHGRSFSRLSDSFRKYQNNQYFVSFL